MNMEYQEYLKSADWKIKRRWMMGNKSCAICHTTRAPLDIHHLNYRNLYDCVKSDLRKLCRDCHFLAHDLHRAGAYKFRSTNHHSRFAILKSAVISARKARGQGTRMFA